MPKRRNYRALDPALVMQTLERLQARVSSRFPDSGLSRVNADLISVGRASVARAAELARPAWLWRILVLSLIVIGVFAQIAAARFLHIEGGGLTAPELVQGLEAAVNLLILFGGAIWFLLTWEERHRRQRALDSLHYLRSMAHVIDMHQLTKDPTVLLQGHSSTGASPKRTMTRFELTRYLDYCAEMLALIGKLAALYAERMRDAVVIEAVNDLENLTTSLGRKIWQKITILSQLEERER